MWTYLVRKVAGAALTFLATSFVVFLALNVLPGDPARLVVGHEASPELYARVREELGLDRPWFTRYLEWLSGLLRGDLGRSLTYGVPVAELVGKGISVTFSLAGAAMALAVLIAFPLGVISAHRAGGAVDASLMALSQLGTAMPEFWIGLLLVLVFSLRLGLLPSGWFPGWEEGPSAGVYLILPALTLALPRGGYLARMVRGSLLSSLRENYVAAARAKGLPEWKVVLRHALKPSLVPVLASGGMVFGRLLAGALVVENLFYLPGLGKLALSGVMARDIPLVQGTAVVAAGAIIAVSLITEISYGLLDPRIRYR